MSNNFPYRWSPASLTFNNYFYLFLYLYITRITINNNTPHLKSPKNQNRRAALGRPEVELPGGSNQPAVDQPPPPAPHWLLRHLIVWFAWKIPSPQVHYLRNTKSKIKSETKQTRGPTETATLKIRSKRNRPAKPRYARPKTTRNGCQSPTAHVSVKLGLGWYLHSV